MESVRARRSPFVRPVTRGAAVIEQPSSESTPVDRLEHDRSVVGAVLAGDREAFRELVDRESGSVVRACHRVLGDLGEAEDVAQEAFVIAFRSLASWRADGPLGAWIARIALRLAVRRASRRRPVTWLTPDTSGLERMTGPDPDPARLALNAERGAQLRAAVAGLEEPYRETIALRFFGERSLLEIAELTGRPLGTVKTHLHRGLLRLRGTLGEEIR